MSLKTKVLSEKLAHVTRFDPLIVQETATL